MLEIRDLRKTYPVQGGCEAALEGVSFSVEAGRFEERDGRTILPLSITCHHAATDGWHVKGFLERVQREADSFEERLTEL